MVLHHLDAHFLHPLCLFSSAWIIAGGCILPCEGFVALPGWLRMAASVAGVAASSKGLCKTDTDLLLVQLAAKGLHKLNDITVKHKPSMPGMVTDGYKKDQKDTFHQLAEINSLFGAGVSLCRPCGAHADLTCKHNRRQCWSSCHSRSLPRWPVAVSHLSAGPPCEARYVLGHPAAACHQLPT